MSINIVETVEGEPKKLEFGKKSHFANWYQSVTLAKRALNELGFYKKDILKMSAAAGNLALHKSLGTPGLYDSNTDFWPDSIEVPAQNASNDAKIRVLGLAETHGYAESDDKEMVIWATESSLFVGLRELESTKKI